MQTIRWGIIGCGDVTEVKSGPALQQARGSRLVAVMRRNADLAEDYARRHDVPRWYSDASELIDDPEVDAVYIATPPGSHLEYALKVAAAGKPCYVEKPMARTHAECERMLEAFARARLPLLVAYYRRALPRFEKVAQLIRDGALGKVTSCRYHFSSPYNPAPPQRWRTLAEHAGGGLFVDIGSHVLDLLDFLLGEFVQFGGDASSSGAVDVEDAVALHFRTSSDVVGTANWNFAGSASEELLEIEGTDGLIAARVVGHSPIMLRRGSDTQNFDMPDPKHIQQPLIQTAVDELLGKGRCPSSGASAARTSRVIDTVLSGYYGGREDAFWQRPQTWRR